jgi:hypothetical protein
MHSLLRLITATAVALPLAAGAASHYVRAGATGTSTGADWTNAYPKLPATLVRGDTYYLAGGSYGSHVFQDAPSGAATITLVRATNVNHGTSTGWSTTYASGPASFTNWQIYTDYYVFDGQRRNADWNLGTTSQYGLRVAGASPVRLDNGAGKGANHVTFRFVDFQGGGRDTGINDDVIYGVTGNSWMTWQYCALHDSDRTIFLLRGNWQHLVIDHSYIARNTSTDAVHGELMSMTDSTDVTVSNNVLEDIEGSAFFAGVNGGTMADWKVFGNVVQHTAAYVADVGRPAHNWGVSGFVFIGIGTGYVGVGNNFQVYNNTFYNVQGLWSGVVIQTGSNNVVRNNVWINSARTNGTLGTTPTISHNWYFNTIADGDPSTTKVVCTSNCAILKDPAHGDFHLVAPLPAGYALPAPYAVDADGVTRAITGGWDRGAFQFPGNVLSTAGHPKSVIVQ